jgi:hypothetical protein
MAVKPINPNPFFDQQDCMGFSGHVDARVLAANTAEDFQAPTGAKYVRIAGDGHFYVKVDTASVTAAVPAADVTDGTASQICPNGDAVWITLPSDQAYLSVIATATRVVTLSYFSA